MTRRAPVWNRFLGRRLQVALDGTAIACAFVVAYLARFELAISQLHFRDLLVQLPWVVAVQLAALGAFGIYDLIWRYVGLADLRRFVRATASGAMVLLAGRLLLPESARVFCVPVSITLMSAAFGFGAVLGLRILRRLVYERFERAESSKEGRRQRKPVLLVGAGRAGVLALREILGRGDVRIEVKGFVDDDRRKVGSVINDVEVLGTPERIPALVRELGIDHVVITMDTGSRGEILRIVEVCDRVPVKVRIIPGLHDILQGRVAVDPMRDIEIEDLLGREPVQLDAEALRGFLHGATVLVTGAGGSIGSELARQATRFAPRRLLLLDRSETLLFEIDQEMRRQGAGAEVVPLIGDIGDVERMRQLFRLHRPDVVLHSAAHKHVPMMESNPGEAVKNNVLGTLRLGEVAGENGCGTFVLISTDKAVNPSSVMGASKRVAELVVQGLEDRYATRFVAVRFGNVLGSTGSVVPIFKEQIRRGGPVTVTHEEMSRYFMTIPEAAQLVLQAGAIGRGGEIFILDMGDPVKIVDVARDMIRLSGLVPDEDIEIRFTGIRPGEKLFEELATSEDCVSRTRHPKIFVGNIPRVDPDVVAFGVEELRRASDGAAIREAFERLVPEATLSAPERVRRPVPAPAVDRAEPDGAWLAAPSAAFVRTS